MGLLDVLAALVTLAGIVVAGYLLAQAPNIFMAAFGPPVDTSWPHGVQEDDDMQWSWSAPAPLAVASPGPPGPQESAAWEEAAPADLESDLELEPVRYAVRSPDRARS